jgi:hypothetical protein
MFGRFIDGLLECLFLALLLAITALLLASGL